MALPRTYTWSHFGASSSFGTSHRPLRKDARHGFRIAGMSTTGFDQAYLHLVQVQTQIATQMLYVTGGLLAAAVIQALTAVWQGVSARKQALIASEQARIAANTLMASLQDC